MAKECMEVIISRYIHFEGVVHDEMQWTTGPWKCKTSLHFLLSAQQLARVSCQSTALYVAGHHPCTNTPKKEKRTQTDAPKNQNGRERTHS